MSHAYGRPRRPASAASCENDVVYLNARVQGPTPEESAGLARATPASGTVSRSGVIIQDTNDYYVSVSRVSFDLDIPVAIAPAKFPEFTADGLTTRWSLTVRYTDAGGNFFYGRAYLKLRKEAGEIVTGQTTQPRDLYCAIWTPEEWREILNTALAEAYAACDTAAGGGVLPTQVPFYSFSPLPSGGKMRLTVHPFSMWNQAGRGAGTFLDLFTSFECVNVFNGWAKDLVTPVGAPLDPNGCDYRFVAFSDGYNYSPPNAAGSESLVPTAPANTTLFIQQLYATQTLPGIRTVAILTSLPTVPEYTPSRLTNSSERVLTDFFPDFTKTMSGASDTTYVYNSAIGDARWIKLRGGATINSFEYQVVTVDWLGTVRPIELYSQSEAVDLKLCFAPRRVIEGAASRN